VFREQSQKIQRDHSHQAIAWMSKLVFGKATWISQLPSIGGAVLEICNWLYAMMMRDVLQLNKRGAIDKGQHWVGGICANLVRFPCIMRAGILYMVLVGFVVCDSKFSVIHT